MGFSSYQERVIFFLAGYKKCKSLDLKVPVVCVGRGVCRAVDAAPQCHDTFAQRPGGTWLPFSEREHQGTQNYCISCIDTISILSFLSRALNAPCFNY